MSASSIARRASRLGLLAALTAVAGTAGAQPTAEQSAAESRAVTRARAFLFAAEEGGAGQPSADLPGDNAVTRPATTEPARLSCSSCHAAAVVRQGAAVPPGAFGASGAFGEFLSPADETLRAQLDLPEGQGVVVLATAEHCPGVKLAIKKDDILLTLAGKPIKDAADFDARRRAIEKSEPLGLIRAGKRIVLTLEPDKAGPGDGGEFYLGVPVSKVNDVLRAHLDLPAGQGLVIEQVIPNSPAARGGLERNDILLSIAGHPVADVKELRERVQASEGRPLTLSVVRKSRPLTLEVTPEKRPAQLPPEGISVNFVPFQFDPAAPPNTPFEVRLFGTGIVIDQPVTLWQAQVPGATPGAPRRADFRRRAGQPIPPADEAVRKQLDEVIKQLSAQAASLQELKAMLAREAKGPGAEK